MYGSSMDGLPAFLIFLGTLIGGAAIGLAWAFVVYVWPWLKGWLHAITA